jgi:hypothetical protein
MRGPEYKYPVKNYSYVYSIQVDAVRIAAKIHYCGNSANWLSVSLGELNMARFRSRLFQQKKEKRQPPHRKPQAAPAPFLRRFASQPLRHILEMQIALWERDRQAGRFQRRLAALGERAPHRPVVGIVRPYP